MLRCFGAAAKKAEARSRTGLYCGRYRDPSRGGESRDDLSNDGKYICSAKTTNILGVAIGAPRRLTIVYHAAFRQLGTPQALRQR